MSEAPAQIRSGLRRPSANQATQLSARGSSRQARHNEDDAVGVRTDHVLRQFSGVVLAEQNDSVLVLLFSWSLPLSGDFVKEQEGTSKGGVEGEKRGEGEENESGGGGKNGGGGREGNEGSLTRFYAHACTHRGSSKHECAIGSKRAP